MYRCCNFSNGVSLGDHENRAGLDEDFLRPLCESTTRTMVAVFYPPSIHDYLLLNRNEELNEARLSTPSIRIGCHNYPKRRQRSDTIFYRVLLGGAIWERHRQVRQVEHVGDFFLCGNYRCAWVAKIVMGKSRFQIDVLDITDRKRFIDFITKQILMNSTKALQNKIARRCRKKKDVQTTRY